VVADITSNPRERSLPTAVEIDSDESGLPEVSYVLCHELATMRRDRLGATPFGRLSPSELWRVEQALEMVIGTRDLPAPPA
jgi:mRNA-degrading endonuclease toxin of MazEF toxin-antitoxin module